MKYSQTFNTFISNAVDKGLMPDPKLGKAASKIERQKQLDPSGDLNVDISKLANGLRNKGLYSEAVALEKKYQIFKEAEIKFWSTADQEISDLFFLAHPDGDTQVANSSYGKFHTLKSTQDEMIKALNERFHKNQIKSLVTATADALGLIKNSKFAGAKEPDDKGTYVGPTPLSKEDEARFTQSDEINKSVEETNKTIDTYQNKIKGYLDDIIAQTQPDYIEKFWTFKSVLENPDKLAFHCHVNGLDANEVKLYSLWSHAGPADLGTATGEGLNIIPAEVKKNLDLENNNVEWDNQKIKAAIQQWVKKYSDVSRDIAGIRAILQQIYALASSINNKFNIRHIRVYNVTGLVLHDISFQLTNLNNLNDIIKTYAANNKNIIPEILFGIVGLGVAASGTLNELKTFIESKVEKDSKDSKDSVDNLYITEKQLIPIRNRLANAVSLLIGYQKRLDPKDRDQEQIKIDIQDIIQLSKALHEPAFTLDKLNENVGSVGGVPRFNSIDELSSFVENIYGAAQARNQKKANQKYNLMKQAKFGVPDAPAGQPQAQQNLPANNTSTNNQLPAATKGPDSQAVARMQLALISLAQNILIAGNKDPNDINTIMRVGRKDAKSLTDVDGRWGPMTNAALTAANKYVGNQLQLGDSATGMMNKSPDDVKTAADKNTAILAQFLSKHGISVEGVTDQSSRVITLDNVLLDSSGDVMDGSIALNQTDLLSLSKLYQFIKSNFQDIIRSNAQGDTGLSIQQWMTLFTSFFGRARQRLANLNGTKSARIAQMYQDLTWNLQFEFNNLLKANHLDVRSIYSGDQSELILDEENFRSSNNTNTNGGAFSKLPSKSVGKNGPTQNNGGSYSGNNQNDQNVEDLSGELGDSSAPPFGRFINLKSYYWRDSNSAQLTPEPIITLQSLGAQVIDQAVRLFPSSNISEKNLQDKYLREQASQLTIRNPDNFEDRNSYIVLDPKSNNRFLLSNSQDYITWSSQFHNGGSLKQYRDFLRSLLNDLHDVYLKWTNQAHPADNLIISVQKNEEVWVQAINRAIEDINRAFSR